MDISKPSGNMVIDIGGGTTDIAILSLGGIVESSSIRIAGNAFDNDIIKYIKDKYKLLVGERTAEEIKITIGTVFPGSRNEKMEVRGRDLVSGLPKNIVITDKDMVIAMNECLNAIVDAIKYTLEKTPPELASDIMNRGIYLTGGGALIYGLDKLISEQTGMPVKIADNPVDCVVLGAGKTVENIDVLRQVLVSRRLK
jgi:rod shape-determining protein MreB